ncbi:hypothetical protein VTJ83DRAFT_4475 [Remersonia thermophila]|uniref:DUF7053 domain-containing protein n=1 Tax=Remersonia thermophila TaxID=72144 RepID=A0ABR4DA27_9PEZI
MLRKKDTFTVITPIPGFIPRQLAIDLLHSHSEVIAVNPLVIEHHPIPAPSHAETDEYYSTWYEITEQIQFVPGIGRMGQSTIKFNGCFHDMPWGLQTHIYAPMHVDLRHKYTVGGNQPGVEPPEVPEIGLRSLGVPADGLYLREDIEVRCNVTVMGFVKSQLKKAGGEMVRRIIKKAELLDAGVLQAMIEDGKLKTINPADRSHPFRSPLPSPTSLRYSASVSGSPPLGSPPLGSPPTPYQIPRVYSTHGYPYRPSTSGSQDSSIPKTSPGLPLPSPLAQPQELPAMEPVVAPPVSPPAQPPVEMPGDFYHAPASMQPGRLPPTRHGSLRESPVDPQQDPYHPRQHRLQQHQQQPQQQQQQHQQHGSASANASVPVGQWMTPPGSRPVSGSSATAQEGKCSGAQPLPPHRETSEEHNQGDMPVQYVPFRPGDYPKIPPLSPPPAGRQPPYGHGQLMHRYS